MINNVQNNILKAAEQHLESQLTPPVRANYDKIVVAGMKVALNKGPDGILAALKNSQDPIKDCVTGAINIVGLLAMQSRGTMPITAAVPACMTLIIHALDFADKVGIMKVGPEELAKAGHMFGNLITQKFGISTDMIKTAAGNIEKLTKDPANMDKLHYAAGMKKAPDATQAIPLQPAAPVEGAA
jgi:hypothetical protein